MNIAHNEIDLKNWKGNLKNSGFLPEERARYEDMSEKDLAAEIKRLEKQMNAEAKNLEFEKAGARNQKQWWLKPKLKFFI